MKEMQEHRKKEHGWIVYIHIAQNLFEHLFWGCNGTYNYVVE